MSLHPELAEALNNHATVEAASAFMYYSMASWFDNHGLKGFGNWCRVEAQGEMNHMRKFFEYVNMRGSQVVFGAIDAPKSDWQAPIEVFNDIHRQEINLTGKINNLAHLALIHNDHATHSFLNTFIMEQVNDESEAGDILAQIKMVDTNLHGLLMISHSLVNRKAASPGA